jgi:Na+-transporting NADH:ubiquinone oxidoreductase subunit C
MTKTAKRAYTVLFMFAVTFVCVSLVAGLSLATHDLVKQNKTLFMKKAVMEACGAEAADSRARLDGWFETCVTTAPSGDEGAFVVADPASGFNGRAVVRSGKGLWGKIVAVIGIDSSGALSGLSILDQNETPGLGGRIEEEWFKKQVRGRKGVLKMNAEGTRSQAPDEIDAITGATFTSRAVLDMLNGAIRDAETRRGGDPGGGT